MARINGLSYIFGRLIKQGWGPAIALKEQKGTFPDTESYTQAIYNMIEEYKRLHQDEKLPRIKTAVEKLETGVDEDFDFSDMEEEY